MLENKTIEGNHYSRIIASWVNGGGYKKYGFSRYFEEWLKTLEFVKGPMNYELVDGKWVCVNESDLIIIIKLSEENIKEIVDLATIGICEFEGWTETWIEQNQERIEKEREERRKKYREKINHEKRFVNENEIEDDIDKKIIETLKRAKEHKRT